MLDESFKFFDAPTTKCRSFKLFAKLNRNHILTSNFSKLCKYQTFGLNDLRKSIKGLLANRITKVWKSCVYDYRAVEHRTFEFLTFKLTTNFPTFKRLQKILWKNFEASKYILNVLMKFYRSTSIYDQNFLDNETIAIGIFFWNLHGRAFCFLHFVKWGIYQSLNLADTSKMCCCGLF